MPVVVDSGVLVGLPVGGGGVEIDAGVEGSGSESVRLWPFLRFLPVIEAPVPTPVLQPDVGIVVDILGQGVVR